jgi:uncharacterized membrane protein
MLFVILRFIHIVFGAIWVGSVFALTLVVAPGMQALGLPLDPLMRALEHRKFSQMMMAIGGLSVLAGIILLYKLSSGFQPQFMSSPFGAGLSFGGLCAIVALVLGAPVQKPAAQNAQAIRADLAANPPKGDDPRVGQVGALQRRIVTVGKLVAALLLLAVSAMAVARYL